MDLEDVPTAARKKHKGRISLYLCLLSKSENIKARYIMTTGDAQLIPPQHGSRLEHLLPRPSLLVRIPRIPVSHGGHEAQNEHAQKRRAHHHLLIEGLVARYP